MTNDDAPKELPDLVDPGDTLMVGTVDTERALGHGSR
jgi:hypothetical protein